MLSSALTSHAALPPLRTALLAAVAAIPLLDGRPLLAQSAGSVEVSLVLAPVVVTDRAGRAVEGLTASDFTLRVDGRETPIAHFQQGDAPFAMAIAIDTSASMVGTRLEAAREAATTLVDRLAPADRALVVGFDHRAQLHTPLTGDREELRRGLRSIRPGGGTSIYDALALAIDALAPEAGRKALVILSDGEDTMSRTSPAAIERRARASQVVVYVVCIGDGAGTGPGRTTSGFPPATRKLRAIAELTGGLALAPGSLAEMFDGYRAIFDEMRAQYTLGFAPPAAADGRWHRIGVNVKRDQVRVRARKGWLAEEPPS